MFKEKKKKPNLSIFLFLYKQAGGPWDVHILLFVISKIFLTKLAANEIFLYCFISFSEIILTCVWIIFNHTNNKFC